MEEKGAAAGRIAFSAAAILCALLAVITDCRIPEPVDDKLLRVVEDTIPPDITLTSPQANGSIRSTVTVAGRITDSAFKANDGGGVLDNIAIQVQAEPGLTRLVKLAGSSFTVTPNPTTPDPQPFTFDFSTGDFSVELDTASIDRSREFIVEATDRNGNTAEARRQLFPSDGMVIQLAEPGTAFTKFQIGGLFTINGTVANSGDDPAISELKSLRWEIVQNPMWSADLLLSTTWSDLEQCYAARINGPFPDVMQPFRLFPDGSFTSSFTIPASGLTTLTVRVIAEDRNGMKRTAEGTAVEDLPYPTFILNLPHNPPASRVVGGSSYYSSNAPSEVITVTGLAATTPQIVELKYDLSSTVGTPVSRIYNASSVPPLSSVMDGAGNLAFTVDTTGRQGDIILTITAKSSAGLVAPFPITIRDDRTAPSITGVSIRSDNAQSAPTGNYAKVDDTVTLDFTLSDAQTGVDPAAVAVTIGGPGRTASVANLGGGAWRATRKLSGGEPQALPYAITTADVIGNTTTASAGSGITFYEGTPTISGLAMTSSNPNANWAKVGDDVTLFFASTRELALSPTVGIASRAVTVTLPSYTAATEMQATDAQGAIAFSIGLTDKAGNVTAITQASATPSPNVTFDSITPDVPSVPVLDPADDSGSSSSDRITRLTTLTFTGTAEAGSTVSILVDGSPAASGTAGGGSYSIDTPVSAGSGRLISARAADAAGNTSAASSTLSVTVDTSVSPAASVPDLNSLDDSGSSSSDNITRLTSLSFTGTAETGATVRLMEGATQLATTTAASGAYSFAAVSLAAGAHTLHAEATDPAGNTSTSGDLVVTVDTSVSPAVSAPDLTDGSDSGSSSSDNITRLTSLSFTGTVETGATVRLMEGATQLASTTAASGAYSFAAVSLAAGAHTLHAEATDPAGNTSTSSDLSITIDTTAPDVPSVPVLDPADDSGSSSSDRITRLTTLTFTGTAEAGSTVSILVDGSPAASGTAGGGSYSIDTPVSAGSGRLISARAADAAGNTSAASSTLSVTVDTSVSPAASVPDLNSLDDSGSSSSDNITRLTSLSFTGTAETGATVRLMEGATQLATTTAASGAYSFAAVSLAAGAHTLHAEATDPAGNTSTSGDLVVTVDTSVSPAVSAPDLTDGSDSGSSSSDNITRLTSLSFTGTVETGATVRLMEGATQLASTTAASGAYSFAAVSLAAGAHTLHAEATDPAGNTSTSSDLSITIDTTAPKVDLFTPAPASVASAYQGSLTLEFAYSEAMDTTTNPTVVFDQDLSGRLVGGPTWSWSSNTATATYTVQTGGTDPASNVKVTVTGASDVAGNTQQAFNSKSGDFAVSRSMTGGGAAPPRSAAPPVAASGGPAAASRVRASGWLSAEGAAAETAPRTAREAAPAPAAPAPQASRAARRPVAPASPAPQPRRTLPQSAGAPSVQDARDSTPVAAAPAPATAADRAEPAPAAPGAAAAEAPADAPPVPAAASAPLQRPALAGLAILCALAAAACAGFVVRRRRGRG